MKKTRKNTAFRLLKYSMGGYKLQFAIVLITIIVSATTSVIGIQFIQKLIDNYIIPLIGNQNPNYTSLLHAIVAMGGIYLVGIIATYIYNRLMLNITQGTLKKIRTDMFKHMQRLPIGYFDSHNHGEIMSTYTNDVDTLREAISQSIPQMFSAIVSMIAILISMIITNVYLTGIVLAMVVIMMFVAKFFAKHSSTHFINQQKNISKVDGYIEEMMNGQKVVKVFCYEERSKQKFDELNEELFQSSKKANSYANTLMPCIMNIGNIGYVLVAVIGGILAVKQVLTIGSIAAFLQYIKAFTNPLGQVSQQINFIAMALAGAERIFDLIDEKVEEDDGYVTLVNAKEEDGKIIEVAERTGTWAWKHPHSDGSITYTKLCGNVELEDVNFGYVKDKQILYNISLDAKEGEKVSFVGPTGAGKTTITNLINRFYDIQSGKIRYDGININKMKKDDLRKSLGVVLQDTHLFTGTVMDNIRYGRLDATDEECIEAAKLANADLFVKHLPDGYQTMLTGDGANLSQGQRQLLAIARAAVANPPALILDEATSSIDSRTEKLVQDGMDKLMHGRTTLVIAHRLSTIKNSDCIMVLEQGHIIERGNHQSLIKEKGKYYQLYTGAIEMD